MKKTIQNTYELDVKEVHQALAEWVALHTAGESHVDEDKMIVKLKFDNHATGGGGSSVFKGVTITDY